MITDRELEILYGENAKAAFYHGVVAGQKKNLLKELCIALEVDYIECKGVES